MFDKRKCGVLAHPTSFPSEYGIGDLGCCKEFIDFLEKAGQKLWAILPLGHTSFGDSPYQSFSTFAGNPLLISPDILIEKKYIAEKDIESDCFNQHNVEYGRVIEYKNKILRKAYAGFKKKKSKTLKTEFEAFCSENAAWLDDYCLFISLKNYFIEERKNLFEPQELKAYAKKNLKVLGENGVKDYFYGACWNSWPADIAAHKPAAVARWTKKLAADVEFYKFCQFEFFSQWQAVKEYANEKSISIIGDIPIFVAADSADTWASRELFTMDLKGYPTEVAGVPPDYFSETGQLWGNPHYDWAYHKKTGYEWWIKRIGSMLKVTDIVRIDHFRAFESYWSIPYGEKTAVVGEWKKGPGEDIFIAAKKALGEFAVIAEDLGDLNPEVGILRDKLGFPGMKILQFAFSDSAENEYLPHNFINRNCIAYTGTHDNDTTIGWYKSMDGKTQDHFRRYLNVSGDNAAWDMIRLTIASSAVFSIIPIQDLMNLPSDARMNVPGRSAGNWQFRFTKEMLTEGIADKLRYLTELFNR